MSIKHDLVEEFNSELEELGKMEVGGEKYKVAVDGITKLADRIIEIDKFETESNDKFESQNIENELKTLQMKEAKRDRMITNCIELAKLGVGFGFAAWAFVASMNFEKEGILTTEGGKSALKSLLKFKF